MSKQINSSSEVLVSLWNELEVSILVIDWNSGDLLFVNRRAYDDIIHPYVSLQNRNYRDIFWPDFIPVYERLRQKCIDGKEHTVTYYWRAKKIWEQISLRLIQWDSNAPCNHDNQSDTVHIPALLISITNIDELMSAKIKYENMAYFNTVLELPNGKKLEEDIGKLAVPETVNLIYFEVDRLSEFNELYGLDVGDNLLILIRNWLLESEKHHGRLYFVDQGFALLNRNVTFETTISRAKEILRRFQSPWEFPVSGNILSRYFFIRLGIVYGKYIQKEIRNILMRTIRAPKSKEGYAIYDDATDRALKEKLSLREILIDCILNRMTGFEVYYQPIVEAQSGHWSGLEALCRFTAPDGTQVPPSEFIQMAEQLELIDYLDAWVSKTAMNYCTSLGLDQKDFFLDINFSPAQKINDSFIDELSRTLTETNFPSNKLSLEITESSKIPFDSESLNSLNRIRELGIELSLDDFGTGYSSFENLIKISAFSLKVDKVFIDNIEEDSYRQYLFQVMVDTAHHLNMKVVAEGVETEEQFQLLQSYRTDYLQGYLFSKPLSSRELKHKLTKFR